MAQKLIVTIASMTLQETYSSSFCEQLGRVSESEFEGPPSELGNWLVTKVLEPFGVAVNMRLPGDARFVLVPQRYRPEGTMIATCLVIDRGRKLICTFVNPKAIPQAAALVLTPTGVGRAQITEFHDNDTYATGV